MFKNNKGITIISLIVTIIVMLILAGIALIMTVGEEGIISKAENAEKVQAEAQKEEEKDLYNAEFYMETGIKTNKETAWEIKEVSEKANVSKNKFAVYSDLHNINQNKENGNEDLKEEYVFYRIDKTTKEERERLKQEGALPLKGDADLDGKLTMNDYNIIEEIYNNCTIGGKDIFDANGVEYMGEYYAEEFVLQIEVADFNCDGYPDFEDMDLVYSFVEGDWPIEDYKEYLEMY